MRALLITLNGVEEVVIGQPYIQTLKLLGDIPPGAPTSKDATLESMWYLIGCDTVTGAGYPDEQHACWVDENALLTLEDGDQVTYVDWYPGYLFGKILVTGFDPKTGNTTEATMSVEELETRITMIGRYTRGPS